MIKYYLAQYYEEINNYDNIKKYYLANYRL